MSIGLIVEVLDHAPPTLTSGERLVLVVIAEWANDKTREARQTNNWNLDTICHRAGIKRAGLKSVLQGLAKKGLEVRVPVKEVGGNPVYAFEGTAMTFRVPKFDQRGGQGLPSERGGHSTPTESRGDATASERGGCGISEGWSQPPPSPQGSPLKKNPSSLSPAEDAEPAAVADPVPRTERENGEASQQPEPQDPIAAMLVEAGCPEDRTDEIRDWVIQSNGVNGFGWWHTVHRNRHLAIHVAEALNALNDSNSGGKPAWCGQCAERTRQRTTEWMGNTSISRCPDCHPLVAQERSSIRSPADRVVADAQSLYEKYRRQELASGRQHKPYFDPPDISAYKTSKL